MRLDQPERQDGDTWWRRWWSGRYLLPEASCSSVLPHGPCCTKLADDDDVNDDTTPAISTFVSHTMFFLINLDISFLEQVSVVPRHHPPFSATK
jgi:hypothetical protein